MELKSKLQKRIRKDGFFMVYGFMLNELKLKGNELLVYAIIYGFSQNENKCFSGSLSYLMAWTGGTDKKTIIKALNSLVNKKLLIKEEVFVDNVKYCRYRALRKIY